MTEKTYFGDVIIYATVIWNKSKTRPYKRIVLQRIECYIEDSKDIVREFKEQNPSFQNTYSEFTFSKIID